MRTLTKECLDANEVTIFYSKYIEKVNSDTDILQGFVDNKIALIQFFSSIPKEKLTYRYQADKWTILDILQHLIDTERIFMYRCLRIARNDCTNLVGFDQNQYIIPAEANTKSMEELLFEYEANRNSSIALLKSLSEKNLSFIGLCDGNKMSARAFAFSVLGHELWHLNMITERYL